MTIPNPYEVLHIDSTATAAEIGRAYRRLMRQYHPDTRLEAHGNEEQRSVDGLLRIVMDAYSLLTDPILRAEYDRQHRQIDSEDDRASNRGDGPDLEPGGADPAAGLRVHVEPDSPSDAVWLFPPAVDRLRNSPPVRVIYYRRF